MTIGSPSSKPGPITSHHRPSSFATSPQACAACKYQRRKCNPDCTLAPYFPANQPRQFLNAHRLFGVSNILKIIRNLDPVHRTDAMRSIIFQSNVRAQDPVGGCHRIIRDLEDQIQRDSDELALVRRQLDIYRSSNIAGVFPKLVDDDDGGGGGGYAATYDTHLVRPQQQHCDNFCYDGGGGRVDHDDYGHADNIVISTIGY